MMIVRNDMPQRRRQYIAVCAFSNENGRIELLCIYIKTFFNQPEVSTTFGSKVMAQTSDSGGTGDS